MYINLFCIYLKLLCVLDFPGIAKFSCGLQSLHNIFWKSVNNIFRFIWFLFALCCAVAISLNHTHTHTHTQGTLGHTQIGTERSLCKLRKIPISSSPKLICHCLLLVSQTNIHWKKSVMCVCVCVGVWVCLFGCYVCLATLLWLTFLSLCCGIPYCPLLLSPSLLSLSLCVCVSVCLLINCCRQHKHANNFIKFPVTATTHTHKHPHTHIGKSSETNH